MRGTMMAATNYRKPPVIIFAASLLILFSAVDKKCQGFCHYLSNNQKPTITKLKGRRSNILIPKQQQQQQQRIIHSFSSSSSSTTTTDDSKNEIFSRSMEDNNIQKILYGCAMNRSVGSNDIIQVLQRLEEDYYYQKNISVTTTTTIDDDNDNNRHYNNISKNNVNGTFELIFSSSVADLPLGIGQILDGYLPNKETIVFDFDDQKQQIMKLSVETLPFVPTIDIVGENLSWNDTTQTLQYSIVRKNNNNNNNTKSEWLILYADENVVAGKSSVTGYNVLRRVLFKKKNYRRHHEMR